MIRFIGCGRSGTKYVSKVMEAVGFDVAHENNGKDGTSSSYAMTPPPYPKFNSKGGRNMNPHDGIDCSKVEWTTTIQIVREPLAQITSAYIVLNARHLAHFDKHIYNSIGNPRLIRCMLYWLEKNNYCESISDYRIRIEDFEDDWSTIQEALNTDVAFPHGVVPKNCHTELRNKIPFAPKEFVATEQMLFDTDFILAQKIMDKAKKYGYGKTL